MKPALIGCGGLLGLCVVVSIIAALFADGDDNEDDNQATAGSGATQSAATVTAALRNDEPDATEAPGATQSVAPATNQPAPTRTTESPTAPASTPQAGGAITLVTAHGGPPGGDAYVEAKVTPGTVCDLDYETPSGTESEAEGLDEKTADANGDIRWDWSISPGTDPGEGEVTVTCGDVSESVSITIG